MSKLIKAAKKSKSKRNSKKKRKALKRLKRYIKKTKINGSVTEVADVLLHGNKGIFCLNKKRPLYYKYVTKYIKLYLKEQKNKQK